MGNLEYKIIRMKESILDKIKEGEHVMQEEGWGEVDKNFGTGTGGDYEIEF